MARRHYRRLAAFNTQIDVMCHLVDETTVAALNAAKLLAELRRRDGTVGGVTGHGMFDGGRNIGRQPLLAKVRNRLRCDPQELGDHLFATAALERRVAGHRAIQVAPSEYTSDCGVGVAPSSTSGAVNAGDPVITPVVVSKTSRDPGDAEVGELRFAVVGEQDVPRLDVPMQSADVVRGFSAPASFTPMLTASLQSSGPCRRIKASSESFA